jgi:hypothetical protein
VIAYAGGITGATKLRDIPRSLLRVSFVRTGDVRDWLTFGREPWPDIVQEIVNAGGAPYAFPVTAIVGVGSDDRAATIDYRVSTNASGSVADFAERVRFASRYAAVVSIENAGPVPGNNDGGAVRVEAGRVERQTETQSTDAAKSPIARATETAGKIATGTASALRIVLIVAGLAAIAYAINAASPYFKRGAK